MKWHEGSSEWVRGRAVGAEGICGGREGGREGFVVDVLCCRSIWDGRKIIWESGGRACSSEGGAAFAPKADIVKPTFGKEIRDWRERGV